METNLFKYILKHTRREQVAILAIVILSQVFYFLSLDLPKTIVNRAIQGEGFDEPGATVPFLAVQFDLPEFLGFLGLPERLDLFSGLDLERIPYLVALSLLFLLLVFINGGFKLHINTQKGRMGERMLRRLRYELFDRVLRFPPHHLRKVKQAEIATMVKDEVEPLGGFIGDAFVQPAFLGGQALTALVFILAQSLYLGLVTVGILMLQGFIIPKLRVRLLRLGKQRQLTARDLAGRIAESVDGITEIHAHDASNYMRADIAARLARIFEIRFLLYQWKFAIKFLNNLLAQLTPFFFYLVGGYLAITGRLDIGGLVAVIAAYKDLPGPVKELIDWDQQRQDVQIKYEQVIEQFSPDGMMPTELQAPTRTAGPLGGPIKAANLTLIEEGGAKLLDGVSFELAIDRHVALVGPEGGGKEALAMVLSRISVLSGGSLMAGETDLGSAPEALTGRAIAYVGPDPYLFATTLRENMLYGLRYWPGRPRAPDPAEAARLSSAQAEARRTGNTELDFAADWTDYAAAGAAGPEDIDQRMIDALRVVEFDEDAYQLGLRGIVDPAHRAGLAQQIVSARAALRLKLADPALAALVEPFDRTRYNRNMTVAENLLFGTTSDPGLAAERVSDHPYVKSILARVALRAPLLAIGHKIADTMVELFADLPAGHPFFEQFSFIAADDLPDVRALLGRADKGGVAGLAAPDQDRLIALAFPYAEARHRLGLIDTDTELLLLAGRRAFVEHVPADLSAKVEFYDEAKYNAAAALQDNILFGRLAYGQAQAAQRIGQLITDVLNDLDLRAAVLQVGLDYQVGVAGKRLSQAQRQKVGLARALLKGADLLVVNGATGAMDGATQAKVLDNTLRLRKGRGVAWSLQRADMARGFDRILLLRDGKLAEQGTFAELDRPGTRFQELAASG